MFMSVMELYLVKFLEYLGECYHIQRTTKKIEYVVRNKTSFHMGNKNKGTYMVGYDLFIYIMPFNEK